MSNVLGFVRERGSKPTTLCFVWDDIRQRSRGKNELSYIGLVPSWISLSLPIKTFFPVCPPSSMRRCFDIFKSIYS